VGNGLVDKKETRKPMQEVIPAGVEWIKESVTMIDVDHHKVKTNQQVIEYQYLIVATGIVPDWSYAEGLIDTIGKNGVFSVYTYQDADYGFQELEKLDKGELLFTMSSGLLKCGGAPQKIMWLSEDYISKFKTRSNFKVHFYKEGTGIFGVEKYRKVFQNLVEKREIIIKTN
jgi:sulfide:quinone oxidoreductase